VLDKNIHSTLISLVNTAGMTNLMMVSFVYVYDSFTTLNRYRMLCIISYCERRIGEGKVKGIAVCPPLFLIEGNFWKLSQTSRNSNRVSSEGKWEEVCWIWFEALIYNARCCRTDFRREWYKVPLRILSADTDMLISILVTALYQTL